MPLLHEPRHFVEAAHNLRPPARVDLLIELLQALAYLHRRGVVHRDLKPSNVLVTPQDHVQLVDFGLATMTHTQRDETSGTLTYMAPETIQSEPATVPTDLFSVGVMAYEMFAGLHPFYSDNMMVLINGIMFNEPDWSALDDVLVEDEITALSAVIMRLLMKAPEDRYQNADDVISDLRAVTGLPPLAESVAVRTSYLEAAQFIGREHEIDQLQQALDRAIAGSGSSWLVGGESGVGKSRLAEELRVRALVKGCLVCRGRASSEDGSTSRLWREILRPLLVQVSLNATETAILKPLVPDIEQLTNQYTLPTIDLPPEDLQKRQLDLIAAVLRRQKRPILMILEDLHWVGEGLRALQHINRIVKEAHVLVIGNFRNDERPQLPSSLPEMQLITLERFSEQDITALSAAMIGGDTGKHPAVIDLLKRETEGNVFFIIQVLRALTNNVARVSDIDVANLPETVFAGGINEVIQRRLANLPEHALPLLKLIAIIGRAIDRKLMLHLTDMDRLNAWLNLCHQLHILEVEGNNWSFSHDKIREYIQREMISDDEAVGLHRQVAGAIEIVYADSLAYMYNRLIYHFEHGQQYGKAIDYLDESANLALRQFENQQVLDNVAHIWTLVEKMTDSSRGTTVLRTARWERMAGEAKYAMRILDESNSHFENALSVLSIGEREDVRSDHYQEATRTMNLLVPIYIYQGEWERALETMDHVLVIYQELGDHHGYLQVMSDIPWLYFLRGHFHTAVERFDAHITYGRQHNIADLVTFSLLGKALATAQIGTEDDIQEAQAMIISALERVFSTTSQTITSFNQMMTYSIAGTVNAHAGNYLMALKYAEMAMTFAKKVGNNTYVMAAGYYGIVGTHLMYWQHRQDSGESVDKQFRKRARDALKLLHQYAQMVPTARPRAWIYQSWFYCLSEKLDKAHQTIGTGISEAFNHRLEYDEAMAYERLVAMLPDDDPSRTEILNHSLGVFASLDAQSDVERVQHKLKTIDDTQP